MPSSSTSAPASKPLLLITSFPGDGHTGPLLRVASGLIQRGYDVAYITTELDRAKAQAIGAEYFEMEHYLTPAKFGELAKIAEIPPGALQLAHAAATVFYGELQHRTERLQETLELLREREPGRQILVIEDGPNTSSQPFRYGRPLPKGFETFPKTLGISPCPLFLHSVDCAPAPLGLPPDSTPSGRLRNMALHKLVIEGPMAVLEEKRANVFKACGCTSKPENTALESMFTGYDQALLLCSPSLEYKLSDMPEGIDFAGCLPRLPVSPDLQYPEWWAEVTNKSESGKKVVFVTQGTVSFNPFELIIPTIEALADRSDLLVIVTLGQRGASLPPTVTLPANARVLDYFPYDAALEHTDVFVSNAGYGGFTHAVMNGVPAVFSGLTQDKPEVAERAAVAGFGVNLRAQTPTADALREGVDEVLTNPKYKKRAMELKVENENMDSYTVIEEHIIRLASSN